MNVEPQVQDPVTTLDTPPQFVFVVDADLARVGGGSALAHY